MQQLELPVRIDELAYEIVATWAMPLTTPAPGSGYCLETSTLAQRHLVAWIGMLAPGQQRRSDHAVAGCEALNGAHTLYHACGRLLRLTVVDCAGRRWRVHPAVHGRAKRLYRFHRWRSPWPHEPEQDLWQLPTAVAAIRPAPTTPPTAPGETGEASEIPTAPAAG